MGVPYSDFDISIKPAASGYTVSARHGDQGEANGDFALPFADEEMQQLIRRLRDPGSHRPSSVWSDAGTDDPYAGPDVKTFGERCFEALFHGDVADLYRDASRSTNRLRLRLRIASDSDLAHLPWEALKDPKAPGPLVLSERTLLVRHLEGPRPWPRVLVQPPLRVLVVTSQPTDLARVTVERELDLLFRATRTLVQENMLSVERLANATKAGLLGRLRQQRPHVLHFIGHGGVGHQGQGLLALEDEHGRMMVLTDADLATLLKDQSDELRLVLLNACDGAGTVAGQPLAGTAQALVQVGVPAIVAMQFPITNDASDAFAGGFYTELVDTGRVEAAVTRGRKEILARDLLEWATPVLFMRAGDGQLFEVEVVDDPERKRRRVTSLATEADESERLRDWTAVAERWREVLSIAPNDVMAKERLRRAEEEPGLAADYAEGVDRLAAGDWAAAQVAFDRVLKTRADYPELSLQLLRARRGQASLGSATAAPSPVSPAGSHVPRAHFDKLVRALLRGDVVPVLGLGVYRCGRADYSPWAPGAPHLPSASELAEQLATDLRDDYRGDRSDLHRVSQQYGHILGAEELEGAIRRVVDQPMGPTPLHDMLATFPRRLRERGYDVPPPLIVVTTYDDLMEKALQAANEPYDIIAPAPLQRPGAPLVLLHWSSTNTGNPEPIRDANMYLVPDMCNRTVLLKLHRRLGVPNGSGDAFIVGEDDLMHLLASRSPNELIPTNVWSRLRNGKVLFLGFSPYLWARRALIYRIWGQAYQTTMEDSADSDRYGIASHDWWAVDSSSGRSEEMYWRKHAVEVVDIALDDYVAALDSFIDQYPFGTSV